MTTKQKLEFIDELLERLGDTAPASLYNNLYNARKYCKELVDDQPTIEPDWNTAPEWAYCHTVDSNGNGHWHEFPPKVMHSEWVCPCDGYVLFSKHYDLNGIDWKQTLTKRP